MIEGPSLQTDLAPQSDRVARTLEIDPEHGLAIAATLRDLAGRSFYGTQIFDLLRGEALSLDQKAKYDLSQSEPGTQEIKEQDPPANVIDNKPPPRKHLGMINRDSDDFPDSPSQY